MKSSLTKIIILSFIFVMSFTMHVAADSGHAYDNLVNDKVAESLKKSKDFQEVDDSDQIREVVDDLITIVSKGDYDRAEANKMIERINGIHENLRQGLIEHGIIMFLVDFQITELKEFAHLKGEIPRGWEDTGLTWDDVPGAGGNPSVARIGHSDNGMGHGSINLELHEIAHPVDGYVLNGISSSKAFIAIQEEEQPNFLPGVYFQYSSEYFAESFAYYFLDENSRAELQEKAPKTYEFIKNLGVTTSKDSLNEAIEEAKTVDEANATPELREALDHAEKVSNNPDATQEEIDKAEANLREAIENSQPQVEEIVDDLIMIVSKGDYDREEALRMVDRIQSIHANLLQGLVDHGIVMKLINFQLTDLPEFADLKGVVPRGWEDTGLTWDDVPGIGGEISVARIGHSDYGMGHSSINLELHEIAHPIDKYVLNRISASEAFTKIQKEEQPNFLPYFYFEYPEEYFAESFAYYFLNDETHAEIKEKAPKTYEFIKNLGVTASKDSLNEAIEEAKAIDEELVTAELADALAYALAYAISVSENPDATQEEIDKAEERLRAAIENANKVPVLKDSLNEAIEIAKAIDEELLTEELTKALAHAISVSENPTATQKEVDEAEAALRAAIKDAVEVPANPVNKDGLYKAIEEASALADKLKTPELLKALENAIDISENPNATQAEVDEAEKMLLAAIAEAKEAKGPKAPANKDTDEKAGKTIDRSKDGKSLPATATNMFSNLLIGFILLLAGGITWFARVRLAK